MGSLEIDFLAIQEHFRFVNVDKFFQRGFEKFFNYAKTGYRAPYQISGRAKVGLAQLSKKSTS